MSKLNKIRSVFNKVEEDWFKDLPLIDLRGLDEAKKREVILNAIRVCIEKVPLEIKEEAEEEDSSYNFISLHHDGDQSAVVITTYYPGGSFVGLTISYCLIPPDQRGDIYEMVNLLNARPSAWRFFVSTNIDAFELESGILITQYFNPQELFLLFRHMLAAGYDKLPLVEEQLSTDHSPAQIMEKHDNEMREFMKANPALFENQK